MNIKKVVFFAVFSLTLSSFLFAKKAGKANEAGNIKEKTLQAVLWEVVSIDEETYPVTQDGILMHMYFLFGEDGNMYLGCKFEGEAENMLAVGNKSMKYELKGNTLVLADSILDMSVGKGETLTLVEREGDGKGEKMVLKAARDVSIEDIKNAQPIDLGDVF